MSTNTISQKHSSRQHRLSLAGLGTGLAFAASVDAAVEGSTDAQSIAAAGTSPSGQRQTISIDIDGDGNTEFDLVGWVDSNTSEVYVRIEPVEAGARVVGSGSFPVIANKLTAEDVVDGGSSYAAAQADVAWSETKGDSGNWLPVIQRGYVGVAFDFDGSTHYGSLDVELTKFTANYNSPASEFDATLHGYVWETIPGTSILAGATATEPQPPAPVPLGSLSFGLILIASLCLLGMRRLRQNSG